MRQAMRLVVLVMVTFGFCGLAFSSDWDVAGKVLTGIEGLRIISGGNIDLIGNIAGINSSNKKSSSRANYYYAYSNDDCCDRIWVPSYVWKKKWIPGHYEYDKKLGKIFIEGHYIKYRIKRGGYWSYKCSDQYHYSYHSR